MKIGIIGGSQGFRLLKEKSFRVVKTLEHPATPYGESRTLYHMVCGAGEFLFLSRHGETAYSVAAPFVNYRANIYALKEQGVTDIVAWSGPGAINDQIAIGSFAVPDDILDETHGRESTFYKSRGLGFLRQGEPFCRNLRDILAQTLYQLQIKHTIGGTYACTQGPRLETPAEIRKYHTLGCDFVGMTLAPECFLARELEMCYAPLCYIVNYAEGVHRRPHTPGKLLEGLATEEETRRVEEALAHFPAILTKFTEVVKAKHEPCACQVAMKRYREKGVIGGEWRDWVS